MEVVSHEDAWKWIGRCFGIFIPARYWQERIIPFRTTQNSKYIWASVYAGSRAKETCFISLYNNDVMKV